MRNVNWLKSSLYKLIYMRVVTRFGLGSLLVWSSFEVETPILEAISAIAGIYILISGLVSIYNGYVLMDALKAVEKVD